VVSVKRLPVHARRAVRSVLEDGLGFVALYARLRNSVRGWVYMGDAHLLYSFARHGQGRGAIVEIGSAWGKSTILLASGSKHANRERVYAIDPHTGDPWYTRNEHLTQFSSLAEFEHNLRSFGVTDWVTPVVATSVEAADTLDTGPIRLLFIDGLHTYEGVKSDIERWTPRVIDGGIVVFDDYFKDESDGVGVQRAVDELVNSGVVGALQRGPDSLVWTTKRAAAL
jgi:predicted O-methyltransferase YrrM